MPNGPSSDTSAAGLRLIDQDAAARVLDRPDAVQDQRLEHQSRLLAVRQREAAEAPAVRREHLHARPPQRRVGDDEAAVGRVDVEGRRIEHAAGLGADVDDLLRRVAGDRVDRVRAAVEHEVLAVVGLLESERIAEGAGDVRREPAGGAKNLDARPGGLSGQQAQADSAAMTARMTARKARQLQSRAS